jgi:type VI secretion system protein
MSEERLLERIGRWKREPQRRDREDPRKTIHSVLLHLSRILNTRRGNVPIAEDYGIPDLADLVSLFPESVREIERALRLVIQKYEPRLKVLRVSFVPQDVDVLSIRFEISARLVTTRDGSHIHLQTVLDGDGKVSVTG